jgi:bacillithiol system protein YtxJ
MAMAASYVAAGARLLSVVRAFHLGEKMREITEESDVEDVLGAPEALLLKHGATCSISANARRELEAFTVTHPEFPVVALEVTEHGTLADKVADQLGVRHASPQVVLLRDGKVAWHAEHFAITAEAIESKLANAEQEWDDDSAAGRDRAHGGWGDEGIAGGRAGGTGL